MDPNIELITKTHLPNAINPACGCGFRFFTRAKCHYPYPKMKYLCPAAKENGAGTFCPVENERPRPNEEVYEVADWFVISDEQCDDCHLDYKIKKHAYSAISRSYGELVRNHNELRRRHSDLSVAVHRQQRGTTQQDAHQGPNPAPENRQQELPQREIRLNPQCAMLGLFVIAVLIMAVMMLFAAFVGAIFTKNMSTMA